MNEQIQNENIEIDLLIEAIYRKYGYDFRNYSKASIRRRIRRRQGKSAIETISQMQHRLLYDVGFFEKLLLDLTINITEMFRDPPFFNEIGKIVIPQISKRPFLKIWNAGCSTGEEAYSTAILLKEAGIFDQARIYATDSNESVLRKAKKGIFPLKKIREYSGNYLEAGGTKSFSDYYTARYDHAIMDRALIEKIIFSDHNLVTDGIFGEMDLIFCRNVLIYFNQELQDRVIQLFLDSLCPDGYLCLGTKETIRLSRHERSFEKVSAREQIYRKKP